MTHAIPDINLANIASKSMEGLGDVTTNGGDLYNAFTLSGYNPNRKWHKGFGDILIGKTVTDVTSSFIDSLWAAL